MEEASCDPGANPAGETNGVGEVCDGTIEEETAEVLKDTKTGK